MQRLRLADPFQLSDEFALSAGGAMYLPASGKCPAPYKYVPSAGNCQIVQNMPAGIYSQTPKRFLRDETDLYLTVPTETGETIKVRADAFDHLPVENYEAIMDIIEPYNAPQMNGLFSKWRERQREKKDQRNERKILKIDARGKGRAATAAAGGGIGGILKSVAGAIFGGGGESDAMATTKGVSVTVGGDVDLPKPFYKKPEIMIPLAIAAAGGIYLLTRKKRRK